MLQYVCNGELWTLHILLEGNPWNYERRMRVMLLIHRLEGQIVLTPNNV